MASRYSRRPAAKPFDNSRPVVLFLSGSALDHTFWALHSRFFAFRNYSVLAPDFPAIRIRKARISRRSNRWRTGLTMSSKSSAPSNISVVGHSQGSLVALEYVSRYPEKVRSVTFIGSGLATPVNPASDRSRREKSCRRGRNDESPGVSAKPGHKHQGVDSG